MVTTVFEDRGGIEKQVDAVDPWENTQTFIHRIPEYLSLGVNGFDSSLQGYYPAMRGPQYRF
ncbi:hypothetical protein [Cyclobacterium xiamenense]|uniref:hypothetical protein n=1 Tax=Cyclobacterium xiamenense TaxID=1297121 RepID=UPI00115FA1AF|nr:hypothetical protein [Cyclobacterium xiamenense]